jgi:molybdopterin synthase catalytic subunit
VGAAEPRLLPLLGLVRVAVNERFATKEDRITEGDDVALIPPVSGGSGQGPFDIRRDPIRVDEVVARVESPGAGAVVAFAGTVRASTDGCEVVALEYEAYESMAIRFLRQIGDEITRMWPEARVAILHRIGRLEVGETSVAIATSSPHRADAFEACRHAIERLKKDVPIWKKEIRRDGSVWVGVGS